VSALPSMAHYLGADVLRSDLLPALLSMVHHHPSWVDASVVTAVVPLLEALPPASHEQLLRFVSKIAHGGANTERSRAWRLRAVVASQLGRLARACPRAVGDVLWPAAIALLQDPVAAVRTAAAREVGPLLAAALPPAQEADGSSGGGGGAAAASPGALGPDCAASPAQDQSAQHGPAKLSKDATAAPADAAQDQSPQASLCAVSAAARSATPPTGGGVSPARREAQHAASLFSSSYGSSYGSSASEDELDLCGLPCALAAPPCAGLAHSPQLQREPQLNDGAGAQHAAEGLEDGGRASAAAPDSDADSGHSGHSSDGSDGSGSECDGDHGIASRPPPAARAPMHPAMMPSGLHPAMAPVGAWGKRAQPRRASSTSRLPAAHEPAAAGVRRRSSASRIACCPSSGDESEAGPDPLCVGPDLYVDSLVARFARSRGFQGRQLFVPMALGLLQVPQLPLGKRKMVQAAAAALATDRVASVRIVAEAAAAALQAAAAQQAPAQLPQGAGGCPAAAAARAPPPLPRAPREAAAAGAGQAPVAQACTVQLPASPACNQGSCAAARPDATLGSQQQLLCGPHVLAREAPSSFKAASAARAHLVAHTATLSVPISIHANH
jgi:hypothetical protein